MRNWVARPRLFGTDLTEDEKQALDLDPQQMAFRQKSPVPKQAKTAGVQSGDIILGFDGKPLKMDAYEFQRFVPHRYVIGDVVKIDVIRDGKRLILPMEFIRR